MAKKKGHGAYTNDIPTTPHAIYTEDFVNGRPTGDSQAPGVVSNRMIEPVTGGPGLSERLPKK